MQQGLRTYDGAVAIITGGASGIGRALAEALVARGARVVLADRQIELAEEVARGLTESGGQATAHAVDVVDANAVESMVDTTFRTAGRIDYYFNNAGIAISGEVQVYRPGDWDRVFDVNLRGVAHGIDAVWPRMIDQGFGHVINTASVAGLIPSPGITSYGATKHAVVGLSKALRVEGMRYGLRCSALCPGFIRTPILDGGRFGAELQKIPESLKQKLWARARPMDPNRFAVEVLKDVARNRSYIIVPRRWRLVWWLQRLAPDLTIQLLGRAHRRMMAVVESSEKSGSP